MQGLQIFFFLTAGNEELLNIYEQMRMVRPYISENQAGSGYQELPVAASFQNGPNLHLLVFTSSSLRHLSFSLHM